MIMSRAGLDDRQGKSQQFGVHPESRPLGVFCADFKTHLGAYQSKVHGGSILRGPGQFRH
jgi:hypothetical protein